MIEALWRAHGRRNFHELADIATGKRRGKRAPPISPLALEAVRRIDALFDIERTINGIGGFGRGVTTMKVMAVRQHGAIALRTNATDWANLRSPGSRLDLRIEAGGEFGQSLLQVLGHGMGSDGRLALGRCDQAEPQGR